MTLEQIGICTGIVSAMFTGIYFIVNYINKKRRRIRRKFIGKWENDGDINWSKFETHYMELELNVDVEDGKITGILRSNVNGEETTSPLCSVNGVVKFNSAKIEITHVRNGELLVYGKSIIKLKKKMLYWKLTEGVADFFPKFTRLHRQSST